jgi:transposase InsO family protein
MSKQAFHQKLNRQMLHHQKKEQVLVLVKRIRINHPRMSARQMYRLIRPQGIGRDRFEAFCFENGLKVSVKRAYHRTTNSLGVTRFTNLVNDFELTAINQVWVSDITYYRLGETFYYLTFILDLYSRVIVGYSISSDLLTTSTTIPALQMALKNRGGQTGVIIHSDGGGQYYCKEWLELTAQHKFKNSMAETVYENPNAERINGIIKNDYLQGYSPENYTELIQMTAKAVMKYNEEKPHGSIGNISPNQFEVMLNNKDLINILTKEKKKQKKKNA